MLHFDNLSKFPQVKHFVSTRSSKIDLGNFVTVKQVHGDNVLVVQNKDVTGFEADAMITDKANIGLAIKVADCVPILFF